VTGNLKHDLLGASAAGREKASAFISAAGWETCPIFTAGSTHPDEEPVIISAWLEAKRSFPALKLIIVPRHTERAAGTENALNRAGAAFTRWSAAIPEGKDCLLVDAMGLLGAFYACSSVCFVGGTLDDTGGHNLLEPALFGKPALFGPNYRNARQAGDALIKGKGGFLTETASQISDAINSLLKDPAALRNAGEMAAKTLSSLKGATARTITAITSALA